MRHETQQTRILIHYFSCVNIVGWVKRGNDFDEKLIIFYPRCYPPFLRSQKYNMKFKISNLGYIKQAEIELGDLTIICGKNNTAHIPHFKKVVLNTTVFSNLF
ncbi:lysine transporter LysE [Aphanothece sacrum FPU1]|uniref:Lysine transporter LysE n=1 Tax=Aphanothece sacrum FPU1 TaxID=1920663 RepID=A0A401ID75_APHSA|nr:lysine transporter LysE [Aphanothece sacrum FPU1]GBF86615.1 lysine transporter LysE [Aphanothece sacrum FPU3]